MGLWTNPLGWLLKIAASLRSPTEQLQTAFGAYPTVSGLSVGEDNALKYTAFYACVRVLSESVASLPLAVFERLERGKRIAREHPVYRLLHDQPNPLITPFVFYETVMAHILIHGNAYAEIILENGQPSELWLISPTRVRPFINGDDLWYEVRLMEGGSTGIPANQMFHVKGLSGEGLVGYSPLQWYREAIGLGMSQEQHGAGTFGNAARPGGILKHPGKPDKQARDNLINSWNRQHQGPKNAHKVALLWEGVEWQQIGLSNEDAQWLDGRKFQAEEMARVHRIPLHMLGLLEHATYSNIEHQGQAFVTETLRPWLIRIEQEATGKLLGVGNDHFAEYKIDALLRGDILSRMNAHAIAISNGIKSRNEAREQENLNPYPGGDEFLIPVNTAQPAQGADGQGDTNDGREAPFNGQQRALRQAADIQCAAAFARVVRKECKAVRDAARRKNGDFASWVKTWYEKYELEALEIIQTPYEIRAIAEGRTLADGSREALLEVRQHISSGRGQLLALAREHPDNLPAAVARRVAEWEAD